MYDIHKTLMNSVCTWIPYPWYFIMFMQKLPASKALLILGTPDEGYLNRSLITSSNWLTKMVPMTQASRHEDRLLKLRCQHSTVWFRVLTAREMCQGDGKMRGEAWWEVPRHGVCGTKGPRFPLPTLTLALKPWVAYIMMWHLVICLKAKEGQRIIV